MRMGICRPGLEVHVSDGVAFLANRVYDIQSRAAPYVDFLFLDVFDGDDLIPEQFTQPGQAQPSRICQVERLFRRSLYIVCVPALESHPSHRCRHADMVLC